MFLNESHFKIFLNKDVKQQMQPYSMFVVKTLNIIKRRIFFFSMQHYQCDEI